MKALLVGTEWFPNEPGGLQRYFYELTHALPSAAVTGTALVTYLKPGQNAPLCLKATANANASLIRRWTGIRRTVQNCLHEDFDVINSHFALYTYPWIRDIPERTPLVVHFHGPYADELSLESGGLMSHVRTILARHIERAVYRRADRIITLSDAFKEIVSQRYGVAVEKVDVIPGGVDVSLYASAPERKNARACLGWPQERPILLAVRRLSRRMGLEGLIEAMAEVRKAHPSVLLLIGGKGAIADELNRQIQALNLEDNVRLIGYVAEEHLPVCYAAANLTVVPTIALEGFGLVTVESLASGTPVAGTPIGGTPEILHGLRPALVFESSAPAAIAAQLIAILSTPSLLPARAECRDYAHRYGWETVAPTVCKTFRQAGK